VKKIATARCDAVAIDYDL